MTKFSNLHCTTKEFFERLKKGDTPSFLYKLRDPAWKAYFFETPAMTKASMASDDFEFVLLDAAELVGRRPEPRPFNEHFRKLTGEDTVAVFKSLGGDATLVAPMPVNANGNLECYTHLAAFMQHADDRQVRQFWKVVGATGLRLMDEHPNTTIWMSTAGQGVSWLHLRFDTRPKYYNHMAYTADVENRMKTGGPSSLGGIFGSGGGGDDTSLGKSGGKKHGDKGRYTDQGSSGGYDFE